MEGKVKPCDVGVRVITVESHKFLHFMKRKMVALTEGEEFIKSYLDDVGIKYKAQYEMNSLRNDDKSFRKADFYLPRLKTCIEFNGYWNVNDESKQRYRDKMKIYSENNIPCVYLYPENLGILGYVFHKRILKELKEHGLRAQLLRYKWRRYRNNTRVIGLIITPFYLTFVISVVNTGITTEFRNMIILLCLCIMILGFVDLVRKFVKYIIKEK